MKNERSVEIISVATVDVASVRCVLHSFFSHNNRMASIEFMTVLPNTKRNANKFVNLKLESRTAYNRTCRRLFSHYCIRIILHPFDSFCCHRYRTKKKKNKNKSRLQEDVWPK